VTALERRACAKTIGASSGARRQDDRQAEQLKGQRTRWRFRGECRPGRPSTSWAEGRRKRPGCGRRRRGRDTTGWSASPSISGSQPRDARPSSLCRMRPRSTRAGNARGASNRFFAASMAPGGDVVDDIGAVVRPNQPCGSCIPTTSCSWSLSRFFSFYFDSFLINI
jgi:hypothetical protein